MAVIRIHARQAPNASEAAAVIAIPRSQARTRRTRSSKRTASSRSDTPGVASSPTSSCRHARIPAAGHSRMPADTAAAGTAAALLLHTTTSAQVAAADPLPAPAQTCDPRPGTGRPENCSPRPLPVRRLNPCNGARHTFGTPSRQLPRQGFAACWSRALRHSRNGNRVAVYRRRNDGDGDPCRK